MTPTVPTREPRPDGRSARRRRRMREALLEAAVAGFLGRGVEAVSVEDLLAEADISRATFYQLFSNKNNVLEEILNPLLEEMTGALEALETRPAEDVVDGLVDVWLELRRRHGDAVLLLGRPGTLELDGLAAQRAAVDEALLAALGRAERADVLRNGSGRYSFRLVRAAAVPLLEVYAGHPGAEALFRDAMRALLLRAH